jgi:hypothetical protein
MFTEKQTENKNKRFLKINVEVLYPHKSLYLTLNVIFSPAASDKLKERADRDFFQHCTANEGPVAIQYLCLVPIYVFPEMKLSSLLISNNSKTELLYNVPSSNSYTHISVTDLYISRMFILLQPNMWINPGNVLITHRHMNVVWKLKKGNWDLGGAIPRKYVGFSLQV